MKNKDYWIEFLREADIHGGKYWEKHQSCFMGVNTEPPKETFLNKVCNFLSFWFYRRWSVYVPDKIPVGLSIRAKAEKDTQTL